MENQVKERKKLNSKVKYGLSIGFLVLLIVITFVFIFGKYNISELLNIYIYLNVTYYVSNSKFHN